MKRVLLGLRRLKGSLIERGVLHRERRGSWSLWTACGRGPLKGPAEMVSPW